MHEHNNGDDQFVMECVLSMVIFAAVIVLEVYKAVLINIP